MTHDVEVALGDGVERACIKGGSRHQRGLARGSRNFKAGRSVG
jgi:hypothetical protein